MSSISVAKHNAKDAGRRPFCVGWGTGVPSVAPHTVGVAELGSHSSRGAFPFLQLLAFLLTFNRDRAIIFSGKAGRSITQKTRGGELIYEKHYR